MLVNIFLNHYAFHFTLQRHYVVIFLPIPDGFFLHRKCLHNTEILSIYYNIFLCNDLYRPQKSKVT